MNAVDKKLLSNKCTLGDGGGGFPPPSLQGYCCELASPRLDFDAGAQRGGDAEGAGKGFGAQRYPKPHPTPHSIPPQRRRSWAGKRYFYMIYILKKKEKKKRDRPHFFWLFLKH